MSKLSTKKENVKGTIAALQTVLERYPVLLTTQNGNEKTSLEFMLNILKIMGLTQEDILDWLSGVLADTKDGSAGLLSVIELAVKTAILMSFKETYTCSINPTLPDDVMYSLYDITQESQPIRGNGIEIELDKIDPFGMLNFCPVNKEESIFYFDNIIDYGTTTYKPRTIYKSVDFNAYLWYIINYSNFRTDEQRHKCIWDNRNTYYKQFLQPGGDEIKRQFFEKENLNQATSIIRGIGTKKEFFACTPSESYSTTENNHPASIKVYLNADRYYHTSIIGRKNKTIFEFNADYIYSMRLFDAKSLIAQIVNAVIGIADSTKIGISVERKALTNKIRSIVNRIIETEDSEIIDNDCFYTFTNEEYQELLDAAQLQYDGLYQSGNENGDFIQIDTAYTTEQIYKIESAENLEERKTAVKNTFLKVSDSIASTDETPNEDKYSFKLSIVNKFINEVITQVAVQALSPKVMLLYAINEKVMNPNEEGKKPDSIVSFMQKFQNLIVSIIRKINEIILQQLYDYLMGQLKPLITLFIQKLLLETIMYYKILLEALMNECRLSGWGRNNQNLELDNVVGADIVPVLNHPEEGCRT